VSSTPFYSKQLSAQNKQLPTFPDAHPEGSDICYNVLLLYECLQHTILGMVNRSIERQLLEPPDQIIICDHKDASSEVEKDKSLDTNTSHGLTDGSLVGEMWIGVSQTSTS